MSANDRAESHAIGTAKRMVAYKCVKAAIVFIRQIFRANHFKSHIKIANTLLKPLSACEMTTFPEITVYLVLMKNAFKP